jgi:putative hydrolase of the HAD superfamily
MNNILSSIEGIIFDLDDTLYDKADWIVPAMEFAAKNMGIDALRVWEAATEYIQHKGRVDASIYNYVLLECGQSDSALNIRAFIAWMNQHKPVANSLQLFPRVAETLSKLGLYYKLALVAEGNPDTQYAKIEALGLGNLIPHVVMTDEIEGIKSRLPDPRPIKYALEKLRTRSSHTMYVGDNPLKDFVRANQLGLVTVRVLTGEYSGYSYPSIEHAAHYTIGGIAQLANLLLGNSISVGGSAVEGTRKASA